MTKITLILALALCIAAGCAEEDSTKPQENPSVYSGRFYVTYAVDSTNCDVNIPPNGPSNITVEDSTMTFGSMHGPWIPSEKRGYGKGTIGNDCPNHNPPTHCALCITMTFDMKYVSPDSFAGKFGTCFTYADCSAESCHTCYSMTGKRMN